MVEFESVDDFLGHSGSSRSGGKWLKNWTKDGSIRIWLHTRRLPIASWRHSVPTLNIFDDRRTGEPRKTFWSRDFNCWSDESFLKVQYKRDDDGNLEVEEPRECGLCRLVDAVYKLVSSGKLDWAEPVFKFEGSTDPRDDQVLHAGGLTGMFGSDRLTDQQKQYLASKRIYPSESWRENLHAKLAYVFALVDDDNVGEGVQIAPQTQLVGNKVKKVIRDSQASHGDEAGNPMLRPFCIELLYDKNAQINERYQARRIDKIKLTPEVEKLIKGDPPDLRSAVRFHNQKTMLALLQRHAVVDLPWDQIYDVPRMVAADDEEEFPPREERKPELQKDWSRAAPVTSPAGRRVQEPPPVPTIPCDKCKAPMREDEAKCKSCGATYTFDDQPEPPKVALAPGKVTGDPIPFNKFAR